MKRKTTFIIAITALAAVCFCAPAHAKPEVLQATLDNGLRVVIERNTLAPVATVELTYLVGSVDAPPGFPGMAHAQEHMLFRGSKGLSSDQLSAIVAALGGDFNAVTDQTVTRYFFTVPADLVDVALNIEAVRMREVDDAEGSWEQERGALEQEIAQDLSNPLFVLSSRLASELFAGTPYAEEALGTRDEFRKTTGAMLKKFHQTWYAPNNAVLVVAGDVDPLKTLTTIRSLFGPIPKRPLPKRAPVEFKPLKPVSFTMETDLPYGMALVAYRLPGSDSSDYTAGQVLADVLDSKRARLYALVPDGKALSAGFDGAVLPKSSYGYAFVTYPQAMDGAALLAALREIIAEYVNKGMPEELVEAAKRNEIADAEFRRNSIAGLAAEWSQAIAVEGRANLDADITSVKKVTKADVDRVARSYLNNDAAVTALLLPGGAGKPAKETPLPAKESFAPREARRVAVPDWAQRAMQLPEVPQLDGKTVVSVLPNGLTLIVYPSSISNTVYVLGRVKNNPMLQTPDDKDGVATLLDRMFDYGTKNLDRLAFEQALDEIGAVEKAGVDFSLSVIADRFDRGMSLLADHLLRPVFPEQAFPVVRKEEARAVEGELHSPAYLTSRALRSALYPRDEESFREPSPQIVNSIALDDVMAYYRTVFRPDMTTLIVAGRVTPEQARAAVVRYFGSWTALGRKPAIDLPPAPPNEAVTSMVPDPSRVQADVTLAQTLGITRKDPDYYPLELGRNVLSGSFYASRLYRDLREEAGLVYTVEALLDAGRTRSEFSVIYACDPRNVGRVRSIVQRDLKQMQTEPAGEDELLQAKTLLMRQIILSRASIDGIARELLQLSLEDLPIDEPYQAVKRYRSLTADEVKAAFTRRIRVDDFAQVTLGPVN